MSAELNVLPGNLVCNLVRISDKFRFLAQLENCVRTRVVIMDEGNIVGQRYRVYMLLTSLVG